MLLFPAMDSLFFGRLVKPFAPSLRRHVLGGWNGVSRRWWWREGLVIGHGFGFVVCGGGICCRMVRVLMACYTISVCAYLGKCVCIGF